jgi:circadian clock protein KaiB
MTTTRNSPQGQYKLRLFITGSTPRSTRAIENMRRICEENLRAATTSKCRRLSGSRGDQGLQIVATPTLVKILPEPLRRIIGDLSDRERVLAGLDRAARQIPAREQMTAKPDSRASIGQLASCRIGCAKRKKRWTPSATAKSTPSSSAAPGQQVYTLENADRPYRVLIEQMQEGAVTLTEDGTHPLLQSALCHAGRPIAGNRDRRVDRPFSGETRSSMRSVACWRGSRRRSARPNSRCWRRMVRSCRSISPSPISRSTIRCRGIVRRGHRPHAQPRAQPRVGAANLKLASEIDERAGPRTACSSRSMPRRWAAGISISQRHLSRSARYDQIFGYAHRCKPWFRTGDDAVAVCAEDRAAVKEIFRGPRRGLDRIRERIRRPATARSAGCRSRAAPFMWTAYRCASPASFPTSPNAGRSKNSCARRRRWRRSASSPAASRTTSTTC